LADIPGDLSTTSTLTVGGSTTNVLDSNGDHDWFAINLVAGQQITASIFGITLVDPLLNIRNSAGQVVASNDDIKSGSDRNSEVSFTPTASGTYYIDVGGFNNAYAGTYQVSVQSGTQPPLATVDTIAGYLAQGYWGGDLHHFAASQGGTITVNMSTLNAGEQNLARSALQEWSDIIGVHFQEVTTGGQITFDDSEDTSGNPVAATDASYSGGITSSAHVHISSSWVTRYGTNLNSYSFQTYIHEIGHALGLGHAGDYNGNATYSTDALFMNDAWSTSIMSYFDERQNTYFGSQGFSRDFAVTPMEADIVAMQTLYGLSTTTRSGDTVYGFNSNAGGVYNASLYPNVALTIFDSGGNDTLNYSQSGANQLINLNPETFSNVDGNVGNLSIGRGVVIENAIGGSGADTIIGNSANNVLTGGLGSDVLTGGGGNDTFLDTIAGHNGDKITDFAVGDKIVFSDASLGSFSFSLSGTNLTYSGGSMSLSNAPSGTLVASAAAGGGVQLTLGTATTPHFAVHNDFNGDGQSDLLLRNDDGTVTDFMGTASGGFSSNVVNFNIHAGPDWQIIGTGDFNGDGRVDLMWRSSDGTITDWLGQANGGFAGNGNNFNAHADSSWQVIGTGDFNGDGRADLLWRSTDGTVTDWLGQANGSFVGNNFSTHADPSWQVIGTGDFNGDGRTDLLWRSSDGTVTDWLADQNGGFSGNWNNFNIHADANWQVVGVAEFNGDGIDDLLWRNTSDGTVTDWLGQPSGGFSSNWNNFNIHTDSHWQLADIGDFNGDGRADLVWRSDTGQLTDWLGTPSGGFIDNWNNAATALPTSWHIQDSLV
jgi:Ca2+-binding RTX toxin-like protein